MEDPTVGRGKSRQGDYPPYAGDLAAEGGGKVLVVSSDFQEVATLCDRALVIGRGMITADLAGPASLWRAW